MIRKLRIDDDLAFVARLIYETDSMFRKLFGQKGKAVKRIEKLIRQTNNSFSYSNIYCYFDDGIKGILIGYNFNRINKQWEDQDYSQAFSLLVNFRINLFYKKYKKLLTTESSGYYIECVCVDEKYRQQGIATKLLNYFIKSHENGKYIFYLDVDTKNESAIKIYKKLGFSITGENISNQKSTYSMCKYL